MHETDFPAWLFEANLDLPDDQISSNPWEGVRFYDPIEESTLRMPENLSFPDQADWFTQHTSHRNLPEMTDLVENLALLSTLELSVSEQEIIEASAAKLIRVISKNDDLTEPKNALSVFTLHQVVPITKALLPQEAQRVYEAAQNFSSHPELQEAAQAVVRDFLSEPTRVTNALEDVCQKHPEVRLIALTPQTSHESIDQIVYYLTTHTDKELPEIAITNGNKVLIRVTHKPEEITSKDFSLTLPTEVSSDQEGYKNIGRVIHHQPGAWNGHSVVIANGCIATESFSGKFGDAIKGHLILINPQLDQTVAQTLVANLPGCPQNYSPMLLPTKEHRIVAAVALTKN